MLKKYLLLVALSIAAISWLLIVPVGIRNSYLKVNALKASTTDIVTSVECSGTVEAAKTERVELGCQVKISKNHFQIGDHVQKGEKLLDIDRNVTYQSIASGSLKSSTPDSQISSSEASSALKQALSAGIINNDMYNSLQSQLANSSGVNASGAQTGINGAGDSSQNILDGVEQCLYAPISGTVTSIADGAGGISPAGTTVAEISDLSSFKVKAQVEEKSIKDVKVGQKATVSGSGFGETCAGTVSQIYPVVQDVSSGTSTEKMVYVVVDIDQKTGINLKPGLSATVQIQTAIKRNVVTLPYDYVKQDDSGTEYVYVFKNGQAVKQNIETGIEDDNAVEVNKGVKSGDIIIEDYSDVLANGSRVRLS